MKYMKNILHKLFYTSDWEIAFRKKTSFDDFDSPYVSIRPIKNYWFADPMLFERNGKTYLFCEAFDKKKKIGRIAVFEYLNGTFQNFKIIISENYHMSYPCVFELNGKVFMIPETSENKTLNLYESFNFPFEWKKIKTLIKDCDLADSTVLIDKEKNYLLSYRKNSKAELLLYRFDSNFKELDLVCSDSFSDNIRPAGYFFKFDNKTLRPAQDCTKMYGGNIVFYETNFDNNKLTEKKYISCDLNKLTVDGKRVTRVHTYTATNCLEAIDYSIFKFHLFKRFAIISRKAAIKKRRKAKHL